MLLITIVFIFKPNMTIKLGVWSFIANI